MTFLTRVAGAAALMLSCLASVAAETPEPAAADAGDTAENAEYQLTLEQMRTFTEVFSRIKQDYVEQVDDETLMKSAIRGMLSDLDPHTAYLDQREYDDLEEDTSGRFNGIGIEVVQSNGDLRIVSPIDGTPAARAGIKPGDIIRAINGHSTEDLTLEDAVKHMRGEPGSEVELTLERAGRDEPIELTIQRDVVEVQSVAHRLLEPGFGYLRITAFQNNTPESTREAVEDLLEQSDGRLSGLVLDLRSNPGGVLNSAVGVVDLFLDEGIIVYTEGRSEEAGLEFSADSGRMIGDTSLVVLIDGGTASASEIVAGALQDHGRAVVLGEASFGKGSVQTVLPLSSGNAVKLTTALYYTPDGRSIQARGIRPDIRVRAVTYADDEEEERRREVDLTGHLEVDPDEDAEVPPLNHEQLAREDIQLYQALNLLKGARILTRNNAAR